MFNYAPIYFMWYLRLWGTLNIKIPHHLIQQPIVWGEGGGGGI
jgi:hypothetical protein